MATKVLMDDKSKDQSTTTAASGSVLVDKLQLQRLIRTVMMSNFKSVSFNGLIECEGEASFYEKDMPKFFLSKEGRIGTKDFYGVNSPVWIGLKSLWPKGHPKWTMESYTTTPYIRVNRKGTDQSISSLIDQSKFQELTATEARSQATGLQQQYMTGSFRFIGPTTVNELLKFGDVAKEIVQIIS